jgi:hypothetical protein
MMLWLRKGIRVFLLAIAALLAPLVLTAIYVLVMRGRAASPHFLHVALLALIVLSCVPFVVAMPLGRTTRGLVVAVFVIAWSFLARDVGFGLCIQFGYFP